MKILENGKVREMTSEEIKMQNEAEQKMAQEIVVDEVTNKPTFEDFIYRISQAETVEEVVTIAKEINNKLLEESEVQI